MSKTSLFGDAVFGNAVFGMKGTSYTVVHSRIISTHPHSKIGKLHTFYSWTDTVEE